MNRKTSPLARLKPRWLTWRDGPTRNSPRHWLPVTVAVSVLCAGLGSATATAQDDAAHPDVPADAFYAIPVQTLGQSGVFDGTLCDEGFCPGDALDRATMAVWTVRVLDGADPAPVTSTRFADVDASHPHAAFIERFADLGVTQGCGDGTQFCPDDAVNRAQMAVFLSRAYNLPAGPDPNFSDVPDDAWYAPEVAKLAASGVTQGCGDGTRFCPGQDTTRAQMATFLYRAENPDEPVEGEPAEGSSTVLDSEGPIAVGRLHGCALRSDQTVACWGRNELGQASAPAGTFLAVTAGLSHTCGLRTDQSITCWGRNRGTGSPITPQNVLRAPSGRFTAVAAGSYHTCALHTNQSISCWGRDAVFAGGSQTVLGAPSGTFLAVAAGEWHSCGIRTDGTATCWGSHFKGELNVPAGRFTSITAGNSYSCGIRTDQTIVCWGHSIGSAPTGTFAAVSAGLAFACGLRTDGTIICWGEVDMGQTNAPSGMFTAINASEAICGLRKENTVVCWGDVLEHWGGIVEHQAIVVGPDDDSGQPSEDSSVEMPESPHNVRVEWAEGDSLTIHWQAPSAGSDVVHYAIDRRLAGQNFTAVEDWTGSESVPSSIVGSRGYWDSDLLLDGEFVESFFTGAHFLETSGSNFTTDGAGNYSYIIYFADGRNDSFTTNYEIELTAAVRVVAFNDAGFAVSNIADVPSQVSREHDQLKTFVEQLIAKHRSAVPWLAEVGDYIAAQDRFDYLNDSLGLNPGYALIHKLHCDILSPDRCKSIGYGIAVSYESPIGEVDDISEIGSTAHHVAAIASHELGHIYTLSNDAPRNPLAVVAGHLYMLKILESDPTWRPGTQVSDQVRGECSAAEIFADLAELLAMEQGGPHFGRIYVSQLGYWKRCNPGGGGGQPSAEAIATARTSLSGQVPQWFYDTYQFANGSYDLDALWSDTQKLSSSRHFVMHALRDHFGGYCGPDLDSYAGNPWRDDGCREATVPAVSPFVDVASGSRHSCGLRADGTVECWGSNTARQSAAPSGSFTAVTAGGIHSCGLKSDQTITCWGRSNEGQLNAPTALFTDVAVGFDHSCGLKSDQTITCWGQDYLGATDAPVGMFTSVTAGSHYSCGLRTGGTIECWGGNSQGQSDAPSGRFTAVSAGYEHSCGLGTGGTIECWGGNSQGQSDAPSGRFTAVSAGTTHSCGLRISGTIECWGGNSAGESDPPPGRFTHVSAGNGHSCGLRTDGTIECWGYNRDGRASPPT